MSLRFEHLSKSFGGRRGELEVLRDVDFEVRTSEFMALLGPSGSGKSSLLDLAAGLTEPSQGVVIHNGERIRKPSANRALVFQEYALFPWKTVEANLKYALAVQKIPRRERAARCQRYLELVQLQDFRNAYPHHLSGGMKQRVAIARAMIGDPDMLLMDEPFAALDAITKRHLQHLLLDIIRQTRKTVLFVTHSIDEALFMADRVAVFSARPGRLQEIIELPGQPGQRDSGSPELVRLQKHIWNLLDGQETREGGSI